MRNKVNSMVLILVRKCSKIPYKVRVVITAISVLLTPYLSLCVAYGSFNLPSEAALAASGRMGEVYAKTVILSVCLGLFWRLFSEHIFKINYD